jgi:arylsulfatase A-like enzyme
VDDIVEHVDILPTTADLLDIRLDKITHDIQGESLLPLMVDRDARRQNSYAFAQRREFEPLPTEHPDYRDWYTGEQFALQNGRFKYILWTNGDDELYDMERDPFELENLINTGLPEEEELRTTLLEKVESLTPKTAIPKVTPDQETRDRLRALGYLP